MQKAPIKEVIERHSDKLMAIPGVVGIYEGVTEQDKPCIKIMIAKKSKETESQIPKTLEGYPVIIDVTGEIKPMKQE